MGVKYTKNKSKSKFFIICLSLMAVGCAELHNNGSGGSMVPPSQSVPPSQPVAPTCSDDVQLCSALRFTALYSGGVFYFNEATSVNRSIKISEGGNQTFYAIVHDSNTSSGKSINVSINSRAIKPNTNVTDNLNGYISSALKMAPENIPSALENYTYAEGYEIFIFTLGENITLDDRVVGEHEISVIPIDGKGLEGSINLFKIIVVIENVNDAPEISAINSAGGVIAIGEDIFEVFEGGDNGTIRVAVRDVDIQHGDIIGLNITNANLPAGVISIARDKLSQSDAINNREGNNREENNQVEFIVHIASGLLQDADIGEYPLSLLVYDELGGAEDSRIITLKVKNTDDESSARYAATSGGVSKLDSVDGAPDTFAINEGQSGRIELVISDEDLTQTSQLEYTITGNSFRAGLLNITRVKSSSFNEEHIFFIDIGKNVSPIDDADIGSYNLNLQVADAARTVNASYAFILKVNNSNDAPEISAINSAGGVVVSGENIFEVFEGGDNGTISIFVDDVDIKHGDIIGLNITNTNLPAGVISIARDKLSQSDAINNREGNNREGNNQEENNQVEFVLNIASGLLQDSDIGEYPLNLLVYDELGGAEDRRTITLKVKNTEEPPFFTQDTHNITIFEQAYIAELPAGTVVATIGEEYCSEIDLNLGCRFPQPILEAASDPDAGDAASLSYSLEPIGAEYFYIDGLQIKTLYPLYFGSFGSFGPFGNQFPVRIIVRDSSGRTAVKKPLVTVWIRGANDPEQDFDSDGVRDPYDGAPTNAAMQTMGSGTRADPYLIHNIYQLQAIAGVDHQGNSLQASEFTGNSYLYGNGLAEQLSSHYRLANDVNASLTATWNGGGGFVSIGVGFCGQRGVEQCDATTRARRVRKAPARFSGIFNGSNFEISGLTINRQSSYIGLFGAAKSGSVIANLRLTSANIINPTTRAYSRHAVKFSHGGVLVGEMLGGTIDNVHVTGTLMGVGYEYGGIAGTLSESENGEIFSIIKNSMADVNITANGVGFGGLVGVLGINSSIHASNAKGNVKTDLGRHNQLLSEEVGGLVGLSYGNIFASYALGDVNGFSYVGGLAGRALAGTTTASFAAGDVEGIKYVGGLFGDVLRGTHRYSYYSGELIGSGDIKGEIGGIVGKLEHEATIYSVLNMRSPHPSSKLSDGGLIFGYINLERNSNSPNIHDAYSITLPNYSLGYITHKRYKGNSIAPLSLLGDNSMSIKSISASHLRNCIGNGLAHNDLADCTGLFNDDYWGDVRVSSLGSNFNVDWGFRPGSYPTLKVQRVTGMGTLDDAIIFPSYQEQRCYIEPAYTNLTHCPTINR